MTRLQGQVDEDRHPKSATTVRQAIAQWLDVAELEDTTRERYSDLIRLYILPTPGDMPASKLDAELLERFTRGCIIAERCAPDDRAPGTSADR